MIIGDPDSGINTMASMCHEVVTRSKFNPPLHAIFRTSFPRLCFFSFCLFFFFNISHELTIQSRDVRISTFCDRSVC